MQQLLGQIQGRPQDSGGWQYQLYRSTRPISRNHNPLPAPVPVPVPTRVGPLEIQEQGAAEREKATAREVDLSRTPNRSRDPQLVVAIGRQIGLARQAAGVVTVAVPMIGCTARDAPTAATEPRVADVLQAAVKAAGGWDSGLVPVDWTVVLSL